MPPQARGRRRVEAMARAAAAPLPLPSLPDEVWEQVMSHFTENRDHFGFALVCKRLRDLVRHGRQLDSTSFLWNEQPECASIRSIADMGLPALPPAVTAMSRLEFLECSMNVRSLTLLSGPYLGSLTLLAADWEALAGSTAVLPSLHKLEGLCLAVLPAGTGAAATAARVLRSLVTLPRLSALYCHMESYSGDRSVQAAVKRLQRAKPALQLKSLKDCPF